MLDWQVSTGLVDYPVALADMDARAMAIAEGRQPERIWLLEHPQSPSTGRMPTVSRIRNG